MPRARVGIAVGLVVVALGSTAGLMTAPDVGAQPTSEQASPDPPAPDPPASGPTQPEAQSFRPLGPTRVLDTRAPGQGPAVGPGEIRNLQLGGVAGIPADAAGVALNVTITAPTAAGFVSVFPAGTAWPGSSNLNFTAGQTVPNMVLIGLGAGGQVSMLNWTGATHIVVDVMGWFTRGFRQVTPTRLLDTRLAGQGPALSAGELRPLQIAGRAGIPAGASAVAVNVTVVSPSSAGFVSLFPAGTAWPGTSTVNFVPGQVVPNMALIGLGSGGRVSIYSSNGPIDVIVDVTGWFADGFQPVTPARLADTRTGRCGFRLGQGDRRSVAILGAAGVPSAGVAAVALNVTATNPTTSTFLSVYPKGQPPPGTSTLNVTRGATVANMALTGLGADGAITISNNLGSVEVIVDVTGWLEGASTARPTFDCQILPAPAPPAPPGFAIPPGGFVVGVHVPPGRYVAPGGAGCSWQRYGPSGELLAAGGGGGGRLLVDLVGGEGFASAGCGTWIGSVAPAGASTVVGDGDWVVSEDLPPGVYQSAGGGRCMWEHRMGFTGAPWEVLDDGLAFGVALVEIAPFEVGFRSRGCGSWRWVGPPTL